jgi:hypothetical protein
MVHGDQPAVLSTDYSFGGRLTALCGESSRRGGGSMLGAHYGAERAVAETIPCR